MALLGIALIGLFAMSWLLDRDALRRSIEAQVRAVAGLELTIRGPIEISIFPASYIAFSQVTLSQPDSEQTSLQVESLRANLRLLPLLVNRFEIADLTLVRPRVTVAIAPDGTSNWSPLIEAFTDSAKAGAAKQLTFSEIRIEGGVVRYSDSHNAERFDDLNLSLAWPSISRSFAAAGQFNWRGERVDGSVSISNVAAMFAGERSNFKARLASPRIKASFDGNLAYRSSFIAEGTLQADGASLRETMRWIGDAPSSVGGFGRFLLKSKANIVGSTVAMTNVNIELDGNVAEGVISISNSGRRNVQATLAAGSLDITPYLSTVKLLTSGARDWNRQLFDFDAISSIDLDVRLSAAKVTIGGSTLGRTAVGATIRGGTLALSVGEALVYGGVMRGSLGLSRRDASANVNAQFQFSDVDMQSCLSDLFGVKRLSGRGNLSMALEASGTSPFGLAQSVAGTASLTSQNGELSGFNAEQLLKRLERRPLSGGGSFRNGQTPFTTLNVSVRLLEGIATIEDVRFVGPTTRLNLGGTISVPAREYDLRGVASLVQPQGSNPAFSLPFVVQGPWDDPLVFPDSDALIRRSPASAPLLDAVKDRKTRDAVRSVLERLTGGGKPAATPDPADAPSAASAPTADEPPAQGAPQAQ